MSEGPGSQVGLTRQASSIAAEMQVKLNALRLGGCDHRTDPENYSMEFWLERNVRELAMIQKNLHVLNVTK